MSFPRYEKYKDSGVAWLGEVPEHWEVRSIKFVISKIDSGTSVNAIDESAQDHEIGVLKTSCVYSGIFNPAENKTVIEQEIGRITCPLKADTLIVSRMNTPDLIGAAGLVTDAPMNIYLPDRLWQVSFSNTCTAFIYFWTQTLVYKAYIKSVCVGTSSSMQNLSQDQFRSFILALPTFDEQFRIAEFLQNETAKIDELITEQQRLIELLKEKRQAVISHAVTKGLNPDAPMKDSGIKWLGEVPVHWIVGPVKYFFTILDGCRIPLSSEERSYKQGNFPYYGASGIIDSIDDYIFDEDLVLVSEDGANLINRATPIAFVLSTNRIVRFYSK